MAETDVSPLGERRSAGDLRLPGPLAFLALDRVEGGAVQGEAGITPEVCALAGTGQRKRYLDSPQSRHDWVIYLETVERLTRQREG